MPKIISKLLQAIADFVVGMAVYFGLQAFAPCWSTNVIIVITLLITSIFAELVEMKMKK